MEEEVVKTEDEEIAKDVDQKKEPPVFLDRRLEIYMRITAIMTSIIVLSILFLLLYFIRRVIGVFALAFLASYIVSPAVRFFEKRKMNRVLVVGLFYLAFVAIVVVSAIIFLPMIWDELRTLQNNIQDSLSDPELGATVLERIESFQQRLSENFPIFKGVDLKNQFDIGESVSGAASWILDYIGQLIKAITSYSGKIIWVGIAMFLIPFITFFLLKDGGAIKRTAMRIIPDKYSESALELLQKVDSQIGRYIRGKIAESIILSILTIIGLRIFGIKYYLVIGSIAGFANLIPYIGPVGISIPPILLALYQYGVARAIMLGIFLIGLQIIDNMILIPLIVGKSVDLHPIVTIFVVFVGAQLLGFLGMIAAVPLASIFISVFQAVYKELRNSATVSA